jgi:hypothetical protein
MNHISSVSTGAEIKNAANACFRISGLDKSRFQKNTVSTNNGGSKYPADRNYPSGMGASEKGYCGKGQTQVEYRQYQRVGHFCIELHNPMMRGDCVISQMTLVMRSLRIDAERKGLLCVSVTLW